MPRNLPPRFHIHIARAQRRRAIANALLVTCLLIGTGGALAQTQLPHQLVATLKPIARELSTHVAQLPSALSNRIPQIDLQLPSQANQLAASATSFPTYIAESVRNLFCRYLAIGCATSLAGDTSRISQENFTNIGSQQHATTSQIVKQPTPVPARSATTTSQVVVLNSHSSPSLSSAPASQPSDRIIETRIIQPDTGYVDARLAALEASIAQRFESMDNANATSLRSASSARTPTSVAANTISGTITNAIDTASAAISSLTATELVATNATTTNLYVSGTARIGSDTGLLQSNTGVVSALATGSDGQVLKVVGGNLAWSSDLTGGGGGANVWATTTDDLALYPADTTDVVLIGASATSTTGNILEVSGNSLLRGALTAYNSITGATFTATSSVASVLPYASTTAITSTTASTTNLIVSSVPGSLLKTNANGQVASAIAGTDYLDAATTLFSTTSANVWQTTRNFFSTTSTDYWETQQTARTADDLSNNSIEDLNDVAAITENYGDLLYWNGAAWADIATSSLGISTTNLVEGSNLFFTDARVQSFIHASSTIPKTYTANTFSALQTFANASTSVLSASTLCLSTDCRTSWPAAGSTFDYLFPANATSTLLGFNGGLTAYASSTIGSGTQAGGLTISGGATTTGTLAVQGNGTSTFAGDVSISGSIVPTADNTYSLGSASRVWKDLFVGPGSIYLNGKKILEDVSNVITFSTDANQNLAIQTAGTGNITSQATGSGNHNILTGSGNINLTSSGAGSINISSASGNLNIGTTGSGQLNLGTITAGTWQGSLIGDSYLTKSGNWTGTFDGLEGSAYLANAFSTTSADFWQTQRNFFSTTSASYFVSVNQGSLFSTTSATYFAQSSTTIPKTYTANTFTALQTFANASTTNLSATYASSTTGIFGSLSVGSLSGFLKATAGAISTALVNLASDITGILSVANGGTGWANIASAAIPYGNGTSALATTTAGTNGQVLALVGGIPTWAATSTLSTITGTLDVNKGGTGGTSFAYGLLLSPGGTGALTNIATSSLGLLTTNVAEGSNLYYLDSRVQTFIHSSSTIPKLYSSNTWTGSNTFSSIALGSLNGPLHANNGVVSATTSIGVLYGGTGLTSAPTYGQVLVGNSSGGYTLTATSSLGISGGSSLFTDGGATTYLTSSDNLGIGTTSASRKLAVLGDMQVGLSATAAGLLLQTNGTAGEITGINHANNTYNALQFSTGASPTLYINTSGNVSINSTAGGGWSSDAQLYSVKNSGAGWGASFYKTADVNISGGAILARVDHTSSPLVNFYYTSSQIGSISTNGSATSYNTTSDRRVKENIGTTTLGLDALMQLPVREFSFKSDQSHATTTGFIAQELKSIFPWSVTTNGDDGVSLLGASSSPWAVDYGRITPLIVKAVQDLANITGTFKANLIAWLADAQNGIENLFAKNLYATNVTADTGTFRSLTASSTLTGELCAQKSDGTKVCLTGDQLGALLSQTAGAATSLSVPSSPFNPPEPSTPSTHENETPDLTQTENELTNSQQPAHENSIPEPPPAPPSPEAALAAPTSPTPEHANENSLGDPPIEPIATPPSEPANDNAPPPATATGSD